MNAAWTVAVLRSHMLTAALFIGPAQAHTATTPPSSATIALAIKGKICITKAGAKFSFGADGRYAYDGFWQSTGSYTIDAKAITITFDTA